MRIEVIEEIAEGLQGMLERLCNESGFDCPTDEYMLIDKIISILESQGEEPDNL